MVDQEDIRALTKHVRCFSESLNNLRNTFKECSLDGVYNQTECRDTAQKRLGEVLRILKEILSKYPLLHSPDILNAAKNIIKKIKNYNYADGEQGPEEYYAAIDQLALSFSSSVSDFLFGDKEVTSPHSPNAGLDQDEENQVYEEEFDPKQYDEEYDRNESEEDSLDHNNSFDNLSKSSGGLDFRLLSQDNEIIPPSSSYTNQNIASPRDLSIQRTDELDKTLLSIEGSVEIALQRTKVWTKYAKDILNYLEKRSHFEAECSKQIAKLAQTTKSSVVEENYLPFQSILMTALDHDIHFSNNYNKNCATPLQNIIDKLSQRQRDHDAKRSKIKARWKNETKRAIESRENLRTAKSVYIRKQKELEKYNKQQQDGKDEKGGFSIGKKKGQEDFIKSADDSEEHYKHCVDEANIRQQELERVKSESLIELRQLVYQCDTTMKQVTIAYFQMMDNLLKPLPVQYRALADSCKNYEEGQQFADFVKLQQSTSNQAMCPNYQFEPYRGEGGDRFNSMRSDVVAISSDDYQPRRCSLNSESEKSKQAWGSLPRNKGSATDDTDSLSSRSLPGSPTGSPLLPRKIEPESDEETRVPMKNQKLSLAAKMHKFKKLRAASKCKECESYVYFNGFECEKCGIICHKKCLERLAIKCGNKRLPRKMTTFGVDFHQHLQATKRKDIPYIMEKCIDNIDEIGLNVKGIYRVSGVKSKVEKLCQQFETGGHLVDLSTTPPHLIASVLKLYLRQLPEPLLTFKLYDSFMKIAKDSSQIKLTELDQLNEEEANFYEDLIKRLHDIVKNLPSANFYTAAKLIRHLRRVADNCEDNQMTTSNLAIVFGPTLLKPEGDPQALSAVMDMSHQTRAVELLIGNDRIFHDDGNLIEYVGNDRHRTTPRHKKTIETVVENDDDDSNIASEFSKELLFMMEKSSQRMDEDRIKPEQSVPNNQDASHQDYDNLHPENESDIISDLPSIQPNTTPYNTQLSDATDNESACSRLSSIDSNELLSSLSADITSSKRPTETIMLEKESVHQKQQTEVEIDDDVWMNQFGKEPLKKSRSISATEIMPVSASTFGIPVKKKKTSSHSRLETTTYTFSIGNTGQNDFSIEEKNEIDFTSNSDPLNLLEYEPSNWVKRDSKERQPVRKHLKAVNVKTTVNVTPAEQASPSSSPHTSRKEFEETPPDLSSKQNENNLPPSTDPLVESEKQVLNMDSDKKASDTNESNLVEPQTLPTKQAPMVLPKPKKPLDKKSWTADLIKSKTQKIPEQPQPGSLNEKLLLQGGRKIVDDENSTEEPVRTASLSQSSVKDIRSRFQNANAGLTTDNSLEDSKKSNEKYV